MGVSIMPHSYGYRARTRDLFSVRQGEQGVIPMGVYLTKYKVGDYVDIYCNSKIQKGMPHKFYHGRTGVVYNVTKTSVGVRVWKEVNGRIMEKKVNLRVEHVKHSKCRDSILRRRKENEQHKKLVRAGKAAK